MSLAMAVPCFKSAYEQVTLAVLTATIMNELTLARNLAITHHENMTYLTHAHQIDWQVRYLQNNKGGCLHRFNKLPSNYHLYLKNSLNYNNAITFTSNGFTHAQRSSFYIIGPTDSMRIIISLSGRVRSERTKH